MSLSGLMIHTADIERKVIVVNPQTGAQKESWQTVYSQVPCRISPYSSSRISYFSNYGLKVTHRIHFTPPISDLSHGDRIKHGSIYYTINGLFDPNLSSWFTVADATIIK